ncbi:hypothetical protein D3C76_1671850 [compost metagenome]
MQPGLFVIILALETQGGLNLGQLLLPDIAIGAITHLPGGVTIMVGQGQRGAEVIQLVVINLGLIPLSFQLY